MVNGIEDAQGRIAGADLDHPLGPEMAQHRVKDAAIAVGKGRILEVVAVFRRLILGKGYLPEIGQEGFPDLAIPVLIKRYGGQLGGNGRLAEPFLDCRSIDDGAIEMAGRDESATELLADSGEFARFEEYLDKAIGIEPSLQFCCPGFEFMLLRGSM
jgi:hypothetical protein